MLVAGVGVGVGVGGGVGGGGEAGVPPPPGAEQPPGHRDDHPPAGAEHQHSLAADTRSEVRMLSPAS